MRNGETVNVIQFAQEFLNFIFQSLWLWLISRFQVTVNMSRPLKKTFKNDVILELWLT